jgi:hypothetical protein
MAMAPQMPVMDEATPPVAEPELTAEEALISVLKGKRDVAQALSEKIKEKWAQYVVMRFHAGLKDDPEHPLTELGLYIASLAKYLATMKANIHKKVLPNTSDMDFFALASKALGLEPVVNRWEAYLREKIKIMVPTSAASFNEQMTNVIDDLLFLGNTVAIVKHKYYEGDFVGDDVIHGPVVERVDPFNAWPDTITVDTAAQANWFIYDPITREELEDPDNGYFNVDTVIEKETESERSKRDPTTQHTETDVDHDSPSEWGHDHLSYERWIYLGRFPKAAVLEELAQSALRTDQEAAGVNYDAVLAELGAYYEFDPMAAKDREWWWIEFVGETPIKCQPWPYWMPQGCGPVEHAGLIRRNGFLWAHGMYDYAAVEERILNSHHRDIVTMARMAARRPKEYDKSRIDQEWLAERGDRLALEPDDDVPVNSQEGKSIIRPIDITSDAIPLLAAEMKRLEMNMRELTGVTTAVEGNDKSDTATQAANNYSQSLVLVEFFATQFEATIFRRIVQRCLCICMQAIKETGATEFVMVPYDEMQLQMLDVNPIHVIGMSMIDVQMQGTSSPGNQLHQMQAMMEWFKLFLPTGAIKIFEAVKMSAKVLGVKGYEQLLAIQDQDDPMRMAYNLLAAFGPQGLKFLPPAAVAAIMAAITGINPAMLMAQPGAAGGPGVDGSGQTPSTPGTNMPVPAGGTGATMQSGSMMSGGAGTMSPGFEAM